MKKFAPIFLLIFITLQLSAQTKQLFPPILHEVSGMVKDSAGKQMAGAGILLTSKRDTIKAITNEEGKFSFPHVSLATFTITVTEIGYAASVRKYLYNEATKTIFLDAIVIHQQANMLNEVVVNGGPRMVVKTDTIEYRAADYPVRDNANVNELLKKMEGVDVGTDNSVTYMGKKVTKAKLNGKDFAGGDVAQAIQNLPADIVSKVQFVDDYGEQANRTGIKDGDPTKVLNITTKANKSVGNIANITTSAGSNDRYEEKLFLQHLNGNQAIGILGNFKNTLNGVASASPAGIGGAALNTAGGSGGTTTSGSPVISYGDQIGKHLTLNSSYKFDFSNVHSINNSQSTLFSDKGNSLATNKSTGNNHSRNHSIAFDLAYSPSANDFLRIAPKFNYAESNSDNSSRVDQTGLLNQNLTAQNSGKSSSPVYGGTAFYQHTFGKSKRNVSVLFTVNNSVQHQDNTQNSLLLFKDSSENVISKLPIDQDVKRTNKSQNYITRLTYVEPLNKDAELEFSAQINYRGYNNNVITSNTGHAGNNIIDSLSNLYKYSFTDDRIALNYHVNKPKYELAAGVMAVPSHLEGTNITKAVSTSRNDFNMIPVFRFVYKWSLFQSLSVNYSGSPSEPSFSQLQPVVDYTDPQNPVFGNPKLKSSFNHSLNFIFSNFSFKQKLIMIFSGSTTLTTNQVVRNMIQVEQPATHSFINEVHYTNLNGTYNVLGNYTISRQFTALNFDLALNGLVMYSNMVGLSNNIKNTVSSWHFNQGFGPKIHLAKWFDLNPYISYDVNKADNTLANSINSDVKTTALSLNGRVLFFKTWSVLYSAGKNYISGLGPGLSNNPFVVNASVEKQLFKKGNGIIKAEVFDLLNQNNFINRTITNGGIVDNKTNALSRYFMLSFIINLQKWNGTPTHNGIPIIRRGDGSFVY